MKKRLLEKNYIDSFNLFYIAFKRGKIIHKINTLRVFPRGIMKLARLYPERHGISGMKCEEMLTEEE